MSAPETPASELYRLDQTVRGPRLVPVQRMDEATHLSVGMLRRVMQAHAREVAGLRSEITQRQRRLDEREAQQAAEQETTRRLQASLQRLAAKNAALIAEKRRLRDAFTGKHPLPNVHYRVEVGRDDTARESLVVTLDTFPHRERVRDALAEARRVAAQHDAQLRQVRLDTTAWRAVLQRVIDA